MILKVRKYFSQLKSGLLTKESFAQNFAITLSGNAISQILGFAFTPFIARIYGPEVYGLFALFVAVVNNISPLTTLQYPAGFVTARDDGEFYRIVRITFLVLIAFTVLSFLFVLLFGDDVLSFFDVPELAPFIYLMPVYFFFMGADHLLLGWSIRLKEFRRAASAKLFSTGISKGFTVAYGLFQSPVVWGMILGNLLLYPFESVIKIGPKIAAGFKHIFARHQTSDIKDTLKYFSAYPLFITPGLMISNLSAQLPVYYFSLVYQPAAVGLFALANSLVNTPLSIIITSSTTVFLQKAAETHRDQPDELSRIVRAFYTKLFWVSLLPLTIFAFTSDWIFKVIFGNNWEQSGVFAGFLAIGAVLSVSASPLAVLFRVLKKERWNFLLNIVFIFMKFLGLWWGVYQENILLSVVGYCVATLLCYAISIFFLFRLVKLETGILFRDTFIVLLLFVLITILKL